MRAKSRYDNCQSRQWRLLFGDPRTQSTPSRYRKAIDLIKPRFVFAQRVLITLLNTACKLTDSFSPWSSFYHSLCLLWSRSNTERRCNGQFKYFCSVFAVMGSFIFCRRLWRWNPERAEPFENEEQRPCSCWSPEVTPSTKMALIEQGDTAAPENCQRLVILGSSKVGKTSLVSRFLNNKFDDGYTPTIEDFHRKIYRIKGEAYRLDILDTSGNHPFPAMRRLSIITGRVFQYFFFNFKCLPSACCYPYFSSNHDNDFKCDKEILEKKLNSRLSNNMIFIWALQFKLHFSTSESFSVSCRSLKYSNYVNEADFALWFAKLVCIAEENTEDIIVNEEWEGFPIVISVIYRY